MASGIAYKQAKLAEQWDAIVIGSGIGGLTAAVLLGALFGGVICASVVLGKNLMSVVTKEWVAGSG